MTMVTLRSERAAMYALLRALYDYPLTADLLVAVQSLNLGDDSPLAPYLGELQDRLPNDVTEEAIEDLNIEMTRLLEGPGQPVAPPFASYYLHGSLMGPVMMQVAETYRLWGVEDVSGTQTPPDHVALLFGFLSFLADDSAIADVDESSRMLASREFIRRYLMPWLERFTSALHNGARDPFFGGLAGFTLACVQADYEWLTPEMDEADTPDATNVGDEYMKINCDEVPK